ncbi:hypothetical protein CBS101457_002909 [Exobasidium rhododendri]|nr:hypothetical protein CBS101457_002909 [Exobasidium rhododendri]
MKITIVVTSAVALLCHALAHPVDTDYASLHALGESAAPLERRGNRMTGPKRLAEDVSSNHTASESTAGNRQGRVPQIRAEIGSHSSQPAYTPSKDKAVYIHVDRKDYEARLPGSKSPAIVGTPRKPKKVGPTMVQDPTTGKTMTPQESEIRFKELFPNFQERKELELLELQQEAKKSGKGKARASENSLHKTGNLEKYANNPVYDTDDDAGRYDAVHSLHDKNAGPSSATISHVHELDYGTAALTLAGKVPHRDTAIYALAPEHKDKGWPLLGDRTRWIQERDLNKNRGSRRSASDM